MDKTDRQLAASLKRLVLMQEWEDYREFLKRWVWDNLNSQYSKEFHQGFKMSVDSVEDFIKSFE
jgi:hypothetical protein